MGFIVYFIILFTLGYFYNKNDLKYALKDSKGEEIIFHIRNKDGIAVKRVKPINSNEDKNKKPYYSIGIPGYYEKEIHPIIEKLTKDNKILEEKIRHFKASI